MPPLDFHAVAPELILTAVILFILVYDLFTSDDLKWTIPVIGAAGVLAAAIPVLTLAASGTARSLFGGAYVVDGFSLVLKGIFLGSAFLVLLMSVQYVQEGPYYKGEFYFLLLSAVLGMLVISSARDLITLFIAIELVSSPTYLLAGWRKRDTKSNEAALKYFLLGVVAIAVTLYGMSLLFGVTGGALKFADIAAWMSLPTSASAYAVVAMSVVFIITGFAFKISAVPFHFWAPDTYEGAPTPVAAFLSVASKTAGFVGLFTLLYLAFPAQTAIWRPLIYGLAIATMTVGNLIALKQKNLVRLLAYSSIAQAGYILAPFAATGPNGQLYSAAFASSVTYLLIYSVMNLGAFAVLIAVARRTGSARISDWSGLGKYAPGLALAMSFFLLSLAGIPPTAGMWAKIFVFRSVVNAGGISNAILAGFMAINSVIAAFYYLSVVKRMWFDLAPDELSEEGPIRVPATLATAIAIMAAITFGLFVLPDIAVRLGIAGSLI